MKFVKGFEWKIIALESDCFVFAITKDIELCLQSKQVKWAEKIRRKERESIKGRTKGNKRNQNDGRF